jgi:hypothetical protein
MSGILPDQEPFLADLVVLNQETGAIAAGVPLVFDLVQRLGKIVKAKLDSGTGAALGFPERELVSLGLGIDHDHNL